MIVVYRQRSGSQRFKPEERQTALLLVVLGAGAGGAAATANNGDSQKKQKGRMDGWRGDGTCVWVVGVCVTQAASIACGEGNPTQKEDDYEWGMWMGVDGSGWVDG